MCTNYLTGKNIAYGFYCIVVSKFKRTCRNEICKRWGTNLIIVGQKVRLWFFVKCFSFSKNFRLSKEAFYYVFYCIKDVLPQSKRSTAVTAEINLATALKFLGQGGYQHQIGQYRFAGMAQQTVSNCITDICDAIEQVLCPRYIN